MIFVQGIVAVLLMSSVFISSDEIKGTFAEDSACINSEKIKDSSMVALIETNKKRESYNKLLCVATIVGSHWLLTTASCLVKNNYNHLRIWQQEVVDYTTKYRVRVGADKRAATGNSPGVGGQIYHIDQVRVHPVYMATNKPVDRYNVAMLHVTDCIEFISTIVTPGYLPQPKVNLPKKLDGTSLSLAVVPNFGNTQQLRFSTMEMTEDFVKCTRRTAYDDRSGDDYLPEYFCIEGQVAPCRNSDLGSPVFDSRDSSVVIGVVAHLLDKNHCDKPFVSTRALVLNTTYVREWVLDQMRWTIQFIKH